MNTVNRNCSGFKVESTKNDFYNPRKLVGGFKICTSPYVRLSRNIVCATPPTPIYGFCSYPHTVTKMTWR